MSEQNKSRVKREFTQHLVVFILENGETVKKTIQTRNQESVLAVKPKKAIIALVHSHYVIQIKGTKEQISLEDENHKEDEAFVFGEVVEFEEVAKNVHPFSLASFAFKALFLDEEDGQYKNQKFVKIGETYTTLPKNFVKV